MRIALWTGVVVAGACFETGLAGGGASCPILHLLGDDVRLMIDTFAQEGDRT
jgi:hypothetical protein